MDEHNLVLISDSERGKGKRLLLLSAVVVAAQPVVRQVIHIERLLASAAIAVIAAESARFPVINRDKRGDDVICKDGNKHGCLYSKC